MENSMQEVITEKDKMVPIDTSGDPVEIELKDDNEKEEAIEVQEEEQKEEPIKQEPIEQETEKVSREKPEPEVPVDPYETGDLDNYSKGVKKRINNLVGRIGS